MRGSVLVTGGSGFVGRHLLAELGAGAVAPEVDVTDGDALAAEVREHRPAAVVHLAARASVAASWGEEPDVWRVNVIGTVNVLASVRREAPGARVVVASSGEVYGRAARIPAPEDLPVSPLSPYAASKAAAELACATSELDVVVARAFPQIGPGQDARFAIGSWTSQVAHLEAAGGGALRVGDVSVRRDLIDVRDACRAYAMLCDPAVPAGTYNVATGQPVELRAVVDELVSLSAAPVTVEVDPERIRPVDVPVLSGDPARLQAATGWRPEILLSTSLRDALADARLAEAPA